MLKLSKFYLQVNQKGVVKFLPLLIVIAAVGVISFLLITSTGSFKGAFNILFPKRASHAACGGTFCPNIIPSDIEPPVSNSLSGEYRWYGNNSSVGWPTMD